MRTSRVGPSYVRVTLALDDGGPPLPDHGWDSWVRLFMPRSPGAAPLLPLGPSTGWYARWKELPEETRADIRNETVRAVRTDPATGACELDLDLVVHAGPDGAVTGPAGRWATTAAPGDRAGLLEQGTIIDEALGLDRSTPLDGPLVLLADEAGVPAAESTARSLAAGSRALLVLEVPRSDDARATCSAADVDVRWVVRAAGEASGAAALAHLRRLVEADPALLPADARMVAIGETGAVAGARHFALSAGLEPGRVRACPYWLLDRPGRRRRAA